MAKRTKATAQQKLNMMLRWQREAKKMGVEIICIEKPEPTLDGEPPVLDEYSMRKLTEVIGLRYAIVERSTHE